MSDTKLRMSVDQRIVDIMDELAPEVLEATKHRTNANSLRTFVFNLPDTEDVVKFEFGTIGGWTVSRIKPKKGLWEEQDKDCWTITSDDGLIRITTYGKMCVDINREIIPLLAELSVQVALLEDPIYCPVCNHCGETGCCGYIDFLEKHVRGKTNCIYEEQILNDLEEWIRSEDD